MSNQTLPNCLGVGSWGGGCEPWGVRTPKAKQTEMRSDGCCAFQRQVLRGCGNVEEGGDAERGACVLDLEPDAKDAETLKQTGFGALLKQNLALRFKNVDQLPHFRSLAPACCVQGASGSLMSRGSRPGEVTTPSSPGPTQPNPMARGILRNALASPHMAPVSRQFLKIGTYFVGLRHTPQPTMDPRTTNTGTSLCCHTRCMGTGRAPSCAPGSTQLLQSYWLLCSDCAVEAASSFTFAWTASFP